MRIGIGFDVHRFGGPGPLRLGGVDIPHHSGLIGHSDADVVLHAVCDALLGAVARGDLGEHFPADDERWRGVDGERLVTDVMKIVREEGFAVNNLDVVAIAERPRLAPHREEIRKRLAAMLEIEKDRVSIKATTTEGLGFTGRNRGIAAWSAVTLRPVTTAEEPHER